MKLVYPTAKDIERGFAYIDGLADAVVWKIGSMLEEVTNDAACQKNNNISNGT